MHLESLGVNAVALARRLRARKSQLFRARVRESLHDVLSAVEPTLTRQDIRNIDQLYRERMPTRLVAELPFLPSGGRFGIVSELSAQDRAPASCSSLIDGLTWKRDWEALLDLSFLLILLGDFLGAYRARVAARESLTASSGASERIVWNRWGSERLFLAQLDAGVAEPSQGDCLEDGSDMDPSNLHCRIALTGVSNEQHGRRGLACCSRDLACSFLSGKSIAIVGPITEDEEFRVQVSEFDTVIRLSVLSPIDDPEVLRGTDIALGSYFTGVVGDDIASGRVSAVPEFLDFALFKKPQHTNLFRPSSICHSPVKMFFVGTPMQIPIVHHHAMLHRPARLKIFDTNLYASVRIHNSSYNRYRRTKSEDRGGEARRSMRYRFGLAHHDFLSQWRYLKNLNDRTEFGEVLGSVVGLSEEDYVHLMHARHGGLTIRA